ncbi:MAG: signal peptide peptidase SppA [bacterium]
MKKILKIYFMVVGIITTIFMILFIVGIYNLFRHFEKLAVYKEEKSVTLKHKEYFLRLNLDAAIHDREVSSIENIFSALESKNQYDLLNLLTTIDKAARDDRIKGIVVEKLNIAAPLNSVMEIAEALKRFKEKNKRVLVFIDEVSNKDYLLASVADTIYLQTEGRLYIPGISGSFFFLKDTLSKVGIKGDFIPFGRYKSTPEMFISNKMSEDNRTVTTSVLRNIQDTFIQWISHNRHLSEDEIERILDRGLITAQDAFESKLVDELVYQDQFDERIKETFIDIKPLSFRTYSRVSEETIENYLIDTKNRIALIYVTGQVQMAMPDEYSENRAIVPSNIRRKFEKALEDESIKGIILRVDSPGGSALAADIIWNEVKRLDKEKPVFVSMASMAASGGYYLSMSARKLFAGKTTITGSIGVWAGKFVTKDMCDKLGLTVETIKFNEGASLFSSQENFSSSQRDLIKNILSQTYKTFVDKAAEARGMNYEALHEIAQGRIWTGSQAQEVGLVDTVGGYYEIIKELKREIGIEENTVPTLVKIRDDSDDIFDKLKSLGIAIKSRINYSMHLVHEMRNFFRDENIFFMLPYRVEIQ